MPIFRTAYGERQPVRLAFDPSTSRTKQSFKDECDVNNIMARFQRTGIVEFAQRFQARYGDVRGVDFASAMNVIAEAREMFAAMPAKLRDRFGNDPARFLEFVQDPENRDEARKLGLLKPEVKAPEPSPAAGAPAPAPSPAAAPPAGAGAA